MTRPYYNYRLFFTPLLRPGVYGSTIDVTKDIDITEFINRGGLQSIKRKIDNNDYDFGVFTFGNISLTAINADRKFNDENDAVSIFPYSRDLCKVELRLYDDTGAYTTRFRGLIDEQGTRQDLKSSTIRFSVLSMDSVLRKTEVIGGTVGGGELFSTAIKKILNVPEITNILNYNPANITVDLDLPIDNGDYFTSITAKDAIDDILIAANSILYIDVNENIIVTPRRASANIYDLYGRGDLYGRENILDIDTVSNGNQRAFSSILLNDREQKNEAWIAKYGYRQKDISLDFISNPDTIDAVALNLLNEFKVPKRELRIETLTKEVADIELLDVVRVHYDFGKVPHDDGTPLAITGTAVTGTAVTAYTVGTQRILPNEKWRVIEITEKPDNLISELKLRQDGRETYDGYF